MTPIEVISPGPLTTVEVISPGPLTTIQDLGRAGWAHIGVPRSGAADRESLRLANRLVGNDQGAAALETTLAGPQLRFGGKATVALTGAQVNARVGDRPVAMDSPVEVGEGETLKVGNAKVGLRTYIAFAGGIDVPLVLESAATDTLTGLGPAALTRGQILTLGGRGAGQAPAVAAPQAANTPADAPAAAVPHTEAARSSAPGPPCLRLILGPRDDWFTAGAITRLTSAPFTVTPASNRIGLRLDGPTLERARTDELLSEGLAPGAIQVPAGGQPILLLADHPTTGGYPVIAVVTEADLPVAAQLRPGQQLRFTRAPARSQPRGASWGKRP
jgi:biotin-dependent carboxylase-like uncharacterized protein